MDGQEVVGRLNACPLHFYGTTFAELRERAGSLEGATIPRDSAKARHPELSGFRSTTHPRLLHQEIESVDDGVNESVGGWGLASSAT